MRVSLLRPASSGVETVYYACTFLPVSVAVHETDLPHKSVLLYELGTV